tara:strand:- start:858 stop:2765 length:1908 start_codon:yes stop_codon:yes gene_type:complete
MANTITTGETFGSTDTVTNTKLHDIVEDATFTADGTGATARTVADVIGDVINVKNFGTTGNGSTRDDDHIQAAIDQVETTGGTVYVPPGTYNLQNSLIINSNDVTLFLDKNAELFVNNSMDKPAIIIKGADSGSPPTNVNRITITGGGVINCNSANQSAYSAGSNMPFGIVATNVIDLTIDGIELKNAKHQGLFVSSYIPDSGGSTGVTEIPKAAEGQCQRVKILNNRIIDVQNGGIFFAGGGSGTTDTKECLIQGNYLNDSGISSPDGGTDGINFIDGAQDGIITGNIVHSKGGACIALEAHASRGTMRDLDGVTISNNILSYTNTTIAQGGCISAGHTNNVIKNVVITPDNIMTKVGSNGACINLEEDGLQLHDWTIGGRCILEGTGSDNPMGLNIQSANNTGEYRNIRVHGLSVSGVGSYGIRVAFLNDSNSSTLSISDCTFDATARGIFIDDSANISIKNSLFRKITSECIHVEDSEFISISGCDFMDAASGSVEFIDADRANYITVEGCTSDTEVAAAIDFDDCNFVQVSGCTLRTTDRAVQVNCTATATAGVKITNNEFRGAAAGDVPIDIQITADKAFDGAIIANNLLVSPNGVTFTNSIKVQKGGSDFVPTNYYNEGNVNVQEPATI